jgi:hypothetical protein
MIGQIDKKMLKKPRDAVIRRGTPLARAARKEDRHRWENNEMEVIRESWK